MNKNSEYKINKVAISGNGINELYLDIEWDGDNYLDYYELRVLDRNKEYVESCAFAAHNHRMVIKDYLLGIKNSVPKPFISNWVFRSTPMRASS